MVFLSRCRKERSLQEGKEKILQRFEADGFSIRSLRKRFKPCLLLNLLVMASVLLLVVTTSVLRVEVFLPQQPGTVSVKDRAVNMKAEKEAPDLIQKTGERPIFIEDAVILPGEILLLVRSSQDFKLNRQELSCIFFNQSNTKVLGVDEVGKRSAVRCEIPSQGLPPLSNGVALLQSRGKESILIEVLKKSMPFATWNHLVFEALMLPSEVILFTKGFGEKHGQKINADIWKCDFDGLVDTRVTVAAQQVFRCENPPPSLQTMLLGKKVTLRQNGKLIPSVAYYQPEVANLRQDQLLDSNTSQSKRLCQKSFLCVCTMIYNGAEFLKEWVTYHSFLGVDHFYLYDNNSEDDLQDVVQRLAPYNVSRHPWPWIKSQEAGFSHCSQQAKAQCTWMMYTDIDEFVYPKAWLPQLHQPPVANRSNRSNDPAKGLPILKALILQTSAKEVIGRPAGRTIGQISLKCRDFGPSGLKNNPPQGVMEGYTCRLKKEQRHKSIVQLNAIATSLINVVHHFKLQPDYETVQLRAGKAVINHYKYQAWEEFKKKFKRRVSAYVIDWTMEKKMVSKDRAPGLGTKAIEPPGWENMFCEVHDTALRDYARHLANSSLLSWK
ncbi:hypothetical protein O6H91_13G104500 [Diphasiastrum complanatum]|uniref:Uncharacterized protein n=3 Tax=Diphasiastrum complanatum TaxID=34168 RepID=A0ACC2BY52_DIPCM|nr:hypothetical protein O6H91_13G104500 [Diphasiastrum complanatum]KAJ7534667.1 hypothetical protein O6H91_13G104500 [Diphasiastrum complanatum]KAJ7534668.1 hypothetical protein O6H91_13G104500 [Diphasiastrum complanatum]